MISSRVQMRISSSSPRRSAHTAHGLSGLSIRKGLTYMEVNLDNFAGLRKDVVMETGHRSVPVVFDMRGDTPIFVGGSDHLMEYL